MYLHVGNQLCHLRSVCINWLSWQFRDIVETIISERKLLVSLHRLYKETHRLLIAHT